MNIEHPNELITYLKQYHHLAPTAKVDIQILRGGVSNRTVLVDELEGKRWVLKQALEKLRVKEDWFSDPKRIEKEALGMQWLNRLCPQGAVPQLIFVDPKHHLLAMEAVDEPHECFKTLLLKGQFLAEYFRQFGQLLGYIHAKGAQAGTKLSRIFQDTSFFESLRLEPYYAFTASKLPEAAPFFNALMQACRQHSYTLVHGDYSPKNILVHREKLILLDHEVIHFGDGTFDIGFSLCHLLSKANHLIEHRKELIQGAQLYWQAYLKEISHWDAQKEARAIGHTLACLLARVHGRSPLEYLSAVAKARQSSIVLNIIQHKPSHISGLINQFHKQLQKHV